jgi:hypothetical protein
VGGCGKNEGNGKDEVFGGRKTKRVLEILKRPPLGGGKYKIYFSIGGMPLMYLVL